MSATTHFGLQDMHPFSKEVLCDRLSAFLLCCAPQEACGSIKDQKELMLFRHMLDLTVIHEHDIAKLLCPQSLEAGSWRCWLGLLACLALFHHSVIKTVDALWQVQLAGSALKLCCAHMRVLHLKLE